jgi:hypothetical protein
VFNIVSRDCRLAHIERFHAGNLRQPVTLPLAA